MQRHAKAWVARCCKISWLLDGRCRKGDRRVGARQLCDKFAIGWPTTYDVQFVSEMERAFTVVEHIVKN